MHSKIGNLQLELLNKARSFLQNSKKNDKIHNSVIWYLNSWDSASSGNAYLQFGLMKHISFVVYLKRVLQSAFAIRHLAKLFLITGLTEDINTTYQVLIISWCKKSDFDQNGYYTDRYFNSKVSQHSNALWLLISVDSELPQKTEHNVRIYAKTKASILEKVLFLLKNIFQKVISAKANPSQLKHMLSAESVFAEKIADIVSVLHGQYDFKTVIQPYEAQPFQHAINRSLRQLGVRTVGYLHSVLPPLPTDLIYREDAPELLYVHGKAQMEIMNRLLNWDMTFLRFTPSLRYKKNLRESFSGWLFLPYNFADPNKILNALAYYFSNLSPKTLPVLKPRCHPAKVQSLKHIKLMDDISKLISKYNELFDVQSVRQISIFIGATAAIIEALERDIEVIHITDNPLLESHQHVIWNGLEVRSIHSNIFEYRLLQKESYISMGEDDRELYNIILENVT